MAKWPEPASQGAVSGVVQDESEPTSVFLAPLPTSGDLPGDDVIFINPLTPPLGTSDPDQSIGTVDESREAGVDDTAPFILESKEDHSWVSGAVPVQNVRTPPHECSLCDKMFGTMSALNKHLLTHQQDRPHVCPICQRAFKRHDHLNGHMLTHQKRKTFQCSHPGCNKSYCDAHSLRRHAASQHGAYLIPPSKKASSNPTPTASAQWGAQSVDGPPYLGGSVSHTDYHSIFLSPPKATLDSQHGSLGYSGFTGFASLCGLGLNSFREPSASQAQSLLVLDPQMTGKDSCCKSMGEARPFGMDSVAPQQVDSLEPKPSNACASPAAQQNPEATTGSLGTHYWESDLVIPANELQDLDEILSYQPCREGADFAVQPATPERSSQSKQSWPIAVKQELLQTKPNSKKKSRLKSSSRTEATSASYCTTADKPIWDSFSPAQSFKPDPILPPPSLVAPSCLHEAVHVKPSVTQSQNTGGRKKRVRKRKVKETDLPVPPLPPLRPTLYFAPRRPRQNPLYLVSPSQVAMASFSIDSTPCRPVKVGKLAVTSATGDRPEACARGQTGPRSSEKSGRTRLLSSSSGHCMKGEYLSERAAPVQAGRGEAASGDLLEAPIAPGAEDQTRLSPLVIPVSVPVSDRTKRTLIQTDREHSSLVTGEESEGNLKAFQRRRRSEFLKTLLIPSPEARPDVGEDGSVQWWQSAGVYHSQLRSPMYLADHLLNPDFQPPPYTPPPMLSPLRPGTGLYFNTLPPPLPCLPPPSTYTATLDMTDGISLVMDDTVVTIEPRINVGFRFQAEIPPLRRLVLVLYDLHPAQLVWAPWGDIVSNPQTQQRVTELLDLCCSSVLPGGGTNTELAMHCLHEVQGDVLAALDLLLIRGAFRSPSHPIWDYHYTGSDHWSPREKRTFHRTLVNHGKDFLYIQSVLQTKSVSQCVEYYYATKKRKKYKQCNRGSQRKEGVHDNSVKPQMTESPCGVEEPFVMLGGPWSPLTKQAEADGGQTTTGNALKYTCKVCGRGFEKVKSRSAHMKKHRQQERAWPVRDSLSGSVLGEECKLQEPELKSGLAMKWSPLKL